MTWTAEQHADLTRMVNDPDLSLNDIAREMGMSRNKVIGRIHRDETLKKTFSKHRKSRAPALNGGRPRMKARIPSYRRGLVVANDALPGVSLLEAGRHQCRWILGSEPKEPEFFRCCGKPTVPGSSYCPEHHSIVWVPVKR